MRTILAACAVLALSTPLARAADWDDTEHFSQTLRLDPGGTLRLKTFSGRVTIAATDGREVSIDATRRASADRLARVKIEVRKEGDTVTIDANHTESSWLGRMRNNVVETDFDIKVPRRTNLDISTFSAPVDVRGVEGSYKLHGFSSRLRLDDAVGSIQAHTFSGPVEIRARSWQERQTIEVDTFSGSIQLYLPDDARGALTFNSFSGRLKSELPLVLHGSSRRSLTADLGSGKAGSSLRFKTFSGSVTINR